MSIDVHTIDRDSVIDSTVLFGSTTYGYAVDYLFPLINRFSAQRKLQNPTFYERLRKDLLKGCLMPPITVAFVADGASIITTVAQGTSYINENVAGGYILDGMQRLNALNTVKDQAGFDRTKRLFVTIIISTNKDMLLYRMITLNNGQKPMTPRHQIEVLTEELFDFESLEIEIQSEKDRAERIKRGSFNLADISKGYLAFFTNSVHNDNNRIISEKMDEILVEKIMAEPVVESGLQFQNVLDLIDRLSSSDDAKNWLLSQNNLIGFCVGVKRSQASLNAMSPDLFATYVTKFEGAFRGIETARVNLGKYRRELAKTFIEKIDQLGPMSDIGLLSYFSDEIVQ